jgi:hypothetical protein
MSTLTAVPVQPTTTLGEGSQETVVEDGPRLAADAGALTVVPDDTSFTPVDPVRMARDLRLSRRPARGGTRVEVRRGDLGLGPNLAVGLVDVSEDGAGVRLKAEVWVGEQVEVQLGRAGGGKMFRNAGVVRWCRPEPDGWFLVGLSLRRRLTYSDLLDLGR